MSEDLEEHWALIRPVRTPRPDDEFKYPYYVWVSLLDDNVNPLPYLRACAPVAAGEQGALLIESAFAVHTPITVCGAAVWSDPIAGKCIGTALVARSHLQHGDKLNLAITICDWSRNHPELQRAL